MFPIFNNDIVVSLTAEYLPIHFTFSHMTVHSTKSVYHNSFTLKSTFTLKYTTINNTKKEFKREELSTSDLKSLIYERFLYLRKKNENVTFQDCISDLSKEIPIDTLEEIDFEF